MFTDNNWAGDRSTRNSVSSWTIMLEGCLRPPQPRVKPSICNPTALAAIGVALQRLRHLGVRFLWLQAETASKNFESERCLGLRTWLTLTRNLQTNVRWSSTCQRWVSQRSRNSFVMQFCNKFITVFLSQSRQRDRAGMPTLHAVCCVLPY